MNPTFKTEKKLAQEGNFIICGMDEAGRGAWAGPVVVGAAIFKTHKIGYQLKDSKALTEKARYKLFNTLINDLLDFSIGSASHEEIDAFGMTEALKIASNRCLENLNFEPDVILLDGKHNYLKTKIKSETHIKGDAKIASICVAGLVAKTLRDKVLHSYHQIMPLYNFSEHKGYGTKKHKRVIDIYGPSKIHRNTFQIEEAWNKNTK